MRIGYIPSPRISGASAQPMTDDPEQERRITESEAAFADEHDLRDLEIDRWSWPTDAFPHREEEFELIEQYDLNVACVGLWGKDYMGEEADHAEAELGRALEFAEAADASVFVTGTEVPAEMDEETAWDEGIAFYGDVIDRITARGFTPAFYFGHGDTPLIGYDLEDMRRFTDELPNATLKVDPANLMAGGLDPKRVLDEIASRVGHFHIKDALFVDEGDGDGRRPVDQPPAGMGDVPWGNVVNLLYLGGYDGVLSIEPHGEYWGHRADDTPRRRGIRIAQEQVAQYLKSADRPDYLA